MLDSNHYHNALKRNVFFLSLVALGLAGFAFHSFTGAKAQTEESARSAVVLTIDGPIGPAIADYVRREISKANDAGAGLIILEMDTPGGLDTSMRAIIKDILASSVPVASYVGPSGARAASAGTYIMYASHVAAMAPGTNLGSATPVQMGGTSPVPNEEPATPAEPASEEGADGEGNSSNEEANKQDAQEGGEENSGDAAPSNEDSMRAKVVNDAAAYIQGLAELRERNVEWAVKAVREAKNLTATDAAEQNVIDFVAIDLNELLEKSQGRTVKMVGDATLTLDVKDLSIVRNEPDWATEFLATITHPNVAFLLMTLGFYGLFFELANPGSVFPGVAGIIALILGLYALSVLPVNMAGAGLLVFGIILMIAEAFSPSIGVLGLGGLAAFALGATMLFETESPEFQLSPEVIIATTVASGVFMAFIAFFALGAQAKRVVTGKEHILRQRGVVESWEGKAGWVTLDGERWSAVSDYELQPGQVVKVVKMDGLTLKVAPVR